MAQKGPGFLLYAGDADPLQNISGDDIVADAISQGYTFSIGHTDEANEARRFNPALLIAAALQERIIGEVMALSRPLANSTLRMIGDPLGRLQLPKAGFNLYTQSDDQLVAALDAERRTFDLDELVLGDGESTLGLSRIDAYGNESERIMFNTTVDNGDATHALIEPSGVQAEPLSGGFISLHWLAIDDLTTVHPAEWEIFGTDEFGGLISISSAPKRRYYATTVGPFANGQSVRLAVRASDGVVGGLRGKWVRANAVVADDEAPDPPEILDEEP